MKNIEIALLVICSLLISCSNTDQETANSTDITNHKFTSTDTDCASYVGSYSAQVQDINNNITRTASLVISAEDNSCTFTSNSIPNHDFNDGTHTFPNQVEPVTETYTILRNPQTSSSVTELSLRMDNAIFLNGVKLDLLAAACRGVSNEKIGCHDNDNTGIPSGYSQLWRFDPMHAANNFGTDTNNAHAQPDGAYHYHGTPNKIYNTQQFAVIGFAADGFPIMAPFFEDGSVADSSYKLTTGNREASNSNSDINIIYDGTFIQDYEYDADLSRLDECNGMEVGGVYRYFVTASQYPWVLKCFKGTPHTSFNKNG